jgi:chitinase
MKEAVLKGFRWTAWLVVVWPLACGDGSDGAAHPSGGSGGASGAGQAGSSVTTDGAGGAATGGAGSVATGGASGAVTGGAAGMGGASGGRSGSAGAAGDGGTIGDAGPIPDGASKSDGRIDGPTFDAAMPSDGGSARGPIVAGYYPNWTPSPVRIRDVDPHYNLIYLFVATPVGGSPGTTGAVEWSAPGNGRGAATNFKADLAYARQTQRRKILLSVGGANGSMSFPTRAKSQTFVDSIASLYAQFGGIDGIDLDNFEGGQNPDTAELIWISLELKARFPGFLVTAPPAPWRAADKTFCADMVKAGALDYAAPQYYDGPGLAVQSYIVNSIGEWGKLLGDDHLAVGFGVSSQSNYMTITDAVSTWKALKASHPTLRGAFDWEIHSDEAAGWQFATQMGPLVSP